MKNNTNEKVRLDFITSTERKNWLKETAKKQEISISQLINRLIRNRMLQEEKHTSKETKSNETENNKSNDTNISKYCQYGEIYYIPDGCTTDGKHIIKSDGSYMTIEEYRKS